MGSRIACFMMEATESARWTLRRYSMESCPSPHGYHNAVVDLGRVPYPKSDLDGEEGPEIPKSDPRWTTRCSCGYEFADEDERQSRIHRLFAGAPDGALYEHGTFPPGAMWYSDIHNEYVNGPDGRCLCVTLPPEGGHDWWMIDGKSTNGSGWTRTGTPPLVSVTPSILLYGRDGKSTKYHGFLTDGFLVEC